MSERDQILFIIEDFEDNEMVLKMDVDQFQ